MISERSDLELCNLLGQGNTLAFQEIYNRYAKSMFYYALNIFKDQACCEDVVQTVFIDLWARRGEVEITKLKAYLGQSVRFQVFKQIRKEVKTTEFLSRLAQISSSSDTSNEISDGIDYEELETILKNKVQELPPSCQKIFVMSRFDNKSNKEIAAELHISMQAVKNQISKALKFLRHQVITPIN